MNRADRRRQERCKHRWQTKVFPDGQAYRWCPTCGREECNRNINQEARQ